METQAGSARFGFWSSLVAGATTLVTFALAIATPPMSGPLCKAGCYRYPYTDIAERFPRDYYWMFPALVATLAFVAFAVALHARAVPHRRPLALLGVVLAAMAGVILLGDYFVQLAVIQPSLLAGEVDGVSLLTQFNPHGAFIALEELGYLLMSVALACGALALPRASRLERVARRLLVGGCVITLAALAWFVGRYGHHREYLFELTVISVDWLVLIAGAFLMAVVFRREMDGRSVPRS